MDAQQTADRDARIEHLLEEALSLGVQIEGGQSGQDTGQDTGQNTGRNTGQDTGQNTGQDTAEGAAQPIMERIAHLMRDATGSGDGANDIGSANDAGNSPASGTGSASGSAAGASFEAIVAGFESVAALKPPLMDNSPSADNSVEMPNDRAERDGAIGTVFAKMVRQFARQYMAEEFEATIRHAIRDEMHAYRQGQKSSQDGHNQ